MSSNAKLNAISLLLVGWTCFSNAGKFWQVTDLHVDSNYSAKGDINDMCHGNSGKENIGFYGNYSCDSPWSLAKSAIENMKRIEPNPDFILWTGDSLAHVKESQLNLTKVYQTINRLKILLQDQFPNTTIIPVIGNHDSYPANKFPYENVKAFYQGYLTKAGFEDFIPPAEIKNFLKGGYYSKDIGEDLKIIILNTNLYLIYRTNKTMNNQSVQLTWLKQELKLAQDQNKTVLISAHVPPGFFERVVIIPFLEPQYNDILVELFVNYSSVILSQIYGHTHTDSFRLFFSSRRYLKTHAFIAPSVTPWKIPGTGLHGINPSIRLYDYDVSARMITDYHQFFLNLSQANTEASTSAGDPSKSKVASWSLLYQAKEYYSILNLSTNALGALYQDIATKPEIFSKYFIMNSAGVEADACDKNCQNIHICAMAQVTLKDMEACLKKICKVDIPPPQLYNMDNVNSVGVNESPTTTSIPGLNLQEAAPAYTSYILGLSIGMVAVLIVVVIFFIRKRQLHSGPRYVRHFSHHT